ncbi:hypothetical protein C7M84_021340 [Penaeus vannamei]|uniref:Angiotensin-converting enzyme n=1 Tax=Penaeus vannamei TaxID=6689 RepID=A0A3R7QZR9_PENVA|nr:hypothetical protein C7M84_021340 [Penaeus vannamei]
MNDEMTELIRNATFIDWEYSIDVTDENEEASNAASLMVGQRYKELHAEVIEYFNYEGFEDESLRRQFEMQKTLGTAKLDDEDMAQLIAIVSGMTTTFTSVVCPYDNQECEEVDGLNSDAQFDDAGLMWLEPYNILSENYTQDDFKQDIEDLWNQTQGLYQKLHAYVLYKLKDYYEEIDSDADVIPAHLVGNMWGQSWENIYDIVKPYDTPIPNLDAILEENIDREEEMFELAQQFFTSINLFPMTEDFWNNSLFREPEAPRKAICHASAWDFYDTVNPQEEGRFRIKMCTNKPGGLHCHPPRDGPHQYQMAYSEPIEDRPLVFRDGANPGEESAFPRGHRRHHRPLRDHASSPPAHRRPPHQRNLQPHLTPAAMSSTTAEPPSSSPPDSSSSSAQPPPDRFLTAANEEDQGARASSSSSTSSAAVSSSSTSSSAVSESSSEASADTTEAPETTTEMPYPEEDINFLMKTALAKVAFLPYAYILDKYRWEVFADNNENGELNKLWWEKR